MDVEYYKNYHKYNYNNSQNHYLELYHLNPKEEIIFVDSARRVFLNMFFLKSNIKFAKNSENFKTIDVVPSPTI